MKFDDHGCATMKFDDHGYVTRLAGLVIAGFLGAAIIAIGLFVNDLVILTKIREANKRMDLIEEALRADSEVGKAQVEFDRLVVEAIARESIPPELDLDKLAAEYVEALNAKPVQ